MKNRPDLTGRITFITVCAYQSRPLFGQLANGRLDLTKPSRPSTMCWLAKPEHQKPALPRPGVSSSQ